MVYKFDDSITLRTCYRQCLFFMLLLFCFLASWRVTRHPLKKCSIMAQLVLVGGDRYVANSLYLFLVLLLKSFVSFLVYISSPKAIFFY